MYRFVGTREYSPALSKILEFLDISNFNLGIFFSVQCIFPLDFWSSFSILLVCMTGRLIDVIKKRRKELSKNHASALQKSIAAYLLTLTTLYILNMTFSAFRCYPQDDASYTLLSSPNLECYDQIW